MTGLIRAVAIAVVLSVSAHHASAQVTPQAKPTEKESLKDLLAENENLTTQISKAEKTKGEIAKAELSILGKTDALRRGEQELRRIRLGLAGEQRDIMGQANRAGCAWGSSSKDEAYVKSCNNEADRLNALLQQVQTKAITAVQFEQKLAEGRAAVSDATMELFKKKKANNADLQDLYDGRTDWQVRYNAFVFGSEAYRRLQRMEPESKLCVRISEATHNNALERAAECLKRLWDGAR